MSPILPLDFIEQMRAELGSEAEALFQALETEPPVSIRLNDKRDILTFDSDSEEVPWHKDGYYLSSRPQFTLDPLFHAGCYYVQEASGMFLQQVLEQHLSPKGVVLDLCAAPGGKSTLISQFLGDLGLLVSNEVVRQRVFVLAENLLKWGNGNSIVTNNKPSDFGDGCRNLFDCVLVDAPCSGEGMFRKDLNARQEWSLKQVKVCAERQRKILMDVWDALKPGGILVYSTCTFNEMENEDNVRWIIDCLGAEELPVRYSASWGIVRGNHGYHFYPHLTKGEGLYMCVLRKYNDSFSPFKTRLPKQQPLFNAEADHEVRQWLHEDARWSIRHGERFLTAYPVVHKELTECLNGFLNCVSTGFGIGEWRGRRVVPQHSLSMSKALRREAFPVLNLSLDQALTYLRTEALSPREGMPAGTILLCYEDVPIGFVKNVGNRLNNLYPNEWRIRVL